MSKKNNAQQRQKQIRREKNEAEKAKAKKRRNIIIICLIIAVVTVAFCIIASVGAYKKTNKYKTETVVMSTENYKVDLAMYSYFFTDGYYGLMELQGDSLKELDMYPDITKSLHSQYYYDGTWYDYFENSAKSHAKQCLTLAEAAKAEGISLTNEEKEALKTRAEKLDCSKYSKGITHGDILRCLELELLSVKYEYEKRNENSLQGDELVEYYDKYYKHFSTVSFRRYEIRYGDGLSPIDAEKYANEIKKAKNSEEFTQKLKEVIPTVDPGVTDDAVNGIIDSSFAENYAYSEGDIVTEWLFDSKRQQNDTYVYHNEVMKTHTVYMLTKLPEKTEEETVTVQSIFFSFDSYPTEKDAEQAAFDVKEDVISSDDLEKAMALSALTYTDDIASRYLGGLYENCTYGELEAKAKGIESWCFDEKRKHGDVEIIKTENGCYLLAFVKNGLPSHLAEVQKTVSGEDFAELYMSFETKYPINENEGALSSYDPRK